jgi:hypothetical protein
MCFQAGQVLYKVALQTQELSISRIVSGGSSVFGSWYFSRRVQLQIGRQLKDSAGQDARLLGAEPEWEERDPDHVLLLCKETIELGKSVLVFCGTKRVGAFPTPAAPAT